MKIFFELRESEKRRPKPIQYATEKQQKKNDKRKKCLIVYGSCFKFYNVGVRVCLVYM